MKPKIVYVMGRTCSPDNQGSTNRNLITDCDSQLAGFWIEAHNLKDYSKTCKHSRRQSATPKYLLRGSSLTTIAANANVSHLLYSSLNIKVWFIVVCLYTQIDPSYTYIVLTSSYTSKLHFLLKSRCPNLVGFIRGSKR